MFKNIKDENNKNTKKTMMAVLLSLMISTSHVAMAEDDCLGENCEQKISQVEDDSVKIEIDGVEQSVPKEHEIMMRAMSNNLDKIISYKQNTASYKEVIEDMLKAINSKNTAKINTAIEKHNKRASNYNGSEKNKKNGYYISEIALGVSPARDAGKGFSNNIKESGGLMENPIPVVITANETNPSASNISENKHVDNDNTPTSINSAYGLMPSSEMSSSTEYSEELYIKLSGSEKEKYLKDLIKNNESNSSEQNILKSKLNELGMSLVPALVPDQGKQTPALGMSSSTKYSEELYSGLSYSEKIKYLESIIKNNKGNFSEQSMLKSKLNELMGMSPVPAPTPAQGKQTPAPEMSSSTKYSEELYSKLKYSEKVKYLEDLINNNDPFNNPSERESLTYRLNKLRGSTLVPVPTPAPEMSSSTNYSEELYSGLSYPEKIKYLESLIKNNKGNFSEQSMLKSKLNELMGMSPVPAPTPAQGKQTPAPEMSSSTKYSEELYSGLSYSEKIKYLESLIKNNKGNFSEQSMLKSKLNELMGMSPVPTPGNLTPAPKPSEGLSDADEKNEREWERTHPPVSPYKQRYDEGGNSSKESSDAKDAKGSGDSMAAPVPIAIITKKPLHAPKPLRGNVSEDKRLNMPKGANPSDASDNTKPSSHMDMYSNALSQ